MGLKREVYTEEERAGTGIEAQVYTAYPSVGAVAEVGIHAVVLGERGEVLCLEVETGLGAPFLFHQGSEIIS